MTWDEDDQAKAVAWMLAERERCPGCGTLPHEEHLFKPASVQCRLCAAVDLKKADVFDQRPPKKPGYRIALRRDDAT